MRRKAKHKARPKAEVVESKTKHVAKKTKRPRRKRHRQDAETLCHFTAGSWTAVGFSSPESATGIEGIFGHSIVAAGDRIWCVGGWRETIPPSRKMSVLELQLDTQSWIDVTPCGDFFATPCWRWGHSSCLVTCRLPGEPVLHYLWIAGGFNNHSNLDDVWRFCPRDGEFSKVPSQARSLPYHAAYHSLVCDNVAQQLFLFGGQCCVGGPYQFFDCVLPLRTFLRS